jgi:hypothetical protein
VRLIIDDARQLGLQQGASRVTNSIFRVLFRLDRLHFKEDSVHPRRGCARALQHGDVVKRQVMPYPEAAARWLAVTRIESLSLRFAQGADDAQAGVGPQGVVGARFTYQGQLKQDGAPFNSGSCDFQFTSGDSLTAGAQVTGAVSKLNVVVSRGVFTVPDISFGVSSSPAYLSFSGEAR